MKDEMAAPGARLVRNAALLLLIVSCARQAPPGSNYREVQVVNGGSITGVVRYTGVKPPANPIIVERDRSECGPTLPNASNPGSGEAIAGAIVYLDTITSGKPFAKTSEFATLNAIGCEYSPHLQILRIGTPLSVSNRDHSRHNLRAWFGMRQVVNEPLPQDATPLRVVLADAGLHAFKCDIHPWMRGFVMVASHPYCAITDSMGDFTLANVPPGHYTLKMWRDNWTIDQPRGRTGEVNGYDWGSDFRNQKEVDVLPNAAVTVDFALP